MSIITEIADYLIENSQVVNEDNLFQYAEPAFEEIKGKKPKVIFSLNVSTGLDNPKWARGDYFINFRIRGRSRRYMKACDEAAQTLYTELLGLPNIQVNDSVYFNFRSSEAPRFSGFYEGSEPIFTFTLLITYESTVDIGNRKTF